MVSKIAFIKLIVLNNNITTVSLFDKAFVGLFLLYNSGFDACQASFQVKKEDLLDITKSLSMFIKFLL
jgi:hypothetical protein